MWSVTNPDEPEETEVRAVWAGINRHRLVTQQVFNQKH